MEYRRNFIGKVVRKQRLKKGLSQEVVSGKADISRSHLSDIETGKVDPKAETIWGLSDALGMRPSELIAAAEEEMAKYRGDE